MSGRSRYGMVPTCSTCRGLGWRRGRKKGDWPLPCSTFGGKPCEPAPRALARLLSCSLSTAYRIFQGRSVSLRFFEERSVSLKVIAALVDMAERLEPASRLA